MTTDVPAKTEHNRRPILLTLVGLAKLGKALLLFAAAFGIFHLVHLQDGPRETLLHIVHAIRVDPDNQYVQELLSKVTGLSSQKLAALGVGTFLYAALFTTEGIGILADKRWAEYLAVISTAGFLPVEIYEIVKRPHIIRVTVFIVNALIVVYLIVRLKKTKPVKSAR